MVFGENINHDWGMHVDYDDHYDDLSTPDIIEVKLPEPDDFDEMMADTQALRSVLRRIGAQRKGLVSGEAKLNDLGRRLLGGYEEGDDA